MNQIEKNQVKAKCYNYFTLIVLIIIALLFLFPFYWIITGSFKTQPNKIPPEWFPKTWTMMHWQKLFNSLTAKRFLKLFYKVHQSHRMRATDIVDIERNLTMVDRLT